MRASRPCQSHGVASRVVSRCWRTRQDVPKQGRNIVRKEQTEKSPSLPWIWKPIQSKAAGSKSLARSGGNLTGLFLNLSDLAGKRLELPLREREEYVQGRQRSSRYRRPSSAQYRNHLPSSRREIAYRQFRRFGYSRIAAGSSLMVRILRRQDPAPSKALGLAY